MGLFDELRKLKSLEQYRVTFKANGRYGVDIINVSGYVVCTVTKIGDYYEISRPDTASNPMVTYDQLEQELVRLFQQVKMSSELKNQNPHALLWSTLARLSNIVEQLASRPS